MKGTKKKAGKGGEEHNAELSNEGQILRKKGGLMMKKNKKNGLGDNNNNNKVQSRQFTERKSSREEEINYILQFGLISSKNV